MGGTDISASAVGSPPRVRGKAKAAMLVAKALWITPACAGKSLSFTANYTLSEDHPRVCGEKKGKKP